MQALSGAGPTGVPALKVVDNIVPYIAGEEEKPRAELQKILGKRVGDTIAPHPAPLAATCTRVAVRDGHTVSANLACERPAPIDAAIEALSTYRGPAQELGLPSAPEVPVLVRDEPDRPQPVIDRYTDRGRAATVGRVRPHDAFANGLSYVACAHNHERGTVGNAVIACELVVARGLVGE
jgi:aspartate-semialdehyde dehydrogenase